MDCAYEPRACNQADPGVRQAKLFQGRSNLIRHETVSRPDVINGDYIATNGWRFGDQNWLSLRGDDDRPVRQACPSTGEVWCVWKHRAVVREIDKVIRGVYRATAFPPNYEGFYIVHLGSSLGFFPAEFVFTSRRAISQHWFNL
ncbi:hypothetical protein D9M71_552920 [compost metagenome]